MPTSFDWLLSPNDCPGFSGFKQIGHCGLASGQIHHTEEAWLELPRRYALVNITEKIEEVLARSEVHDGLCYVGAMHITAGIYVNDAESGLLNDIAEWLEKLAPYGRPYRHHQTGEDNGDAHLKSYLTNHQITVPITQSRLHLGTWQQIFYAEFDGQRRKRVLVKILGVGRPS